VSALGDILAGICSRTELADRVTYSILDELHNHYYG